MLKFNILPWKSSGALSLALVNQSIFSSEKTFIRTMTTKYYRIKKKKPAPFPYETKLYNMRWGSFDNTLSRFDENSKIIIVDGPICSHKKELAKLIAEEYELKYVPDPDGDLMYINAYGYDLRNLDPKLPESMQSYDEKKFNLDPFHFNAASFQFNKYRMRFITYLDSLNHLLNTGQGVVMVRSPFSDFVFTEAMYQNGYMSLPAKDAYYKVIRHSLFQLMRPHLVIYLNNSPKKTLENIKKYGEDYEIDSKALTPDFIESVDSFYREKYIEQARLPSELLTYNNLELDQLEEVIEDIESVNFAEEGRHRNDPKFQDWRIEEYWLDEARYEYSTLRNLVIMRMNIEHYDVPELYASGMDYEAYEMEVAKAPGMEYVYGYNPSRNDKVLWKRSTLDKWDPRGD